ncbi:MAG: hypothetical protein LBK42_11195 [Propionibacteriaceae bacterium]|jgi:hypothetical protein|nr:hypothetical protein [Propionibacteriaceae bacterium]
MSELVVAFDPDVWVDLAQAAADPGQTVSRLAAVAAAGQPFESQELADVLGRWAQPDLSETRLLLLADPLEPVLIVTLDQYPAGGLSLAQAVSQRVGPEAEASLQEVEVAGEPCLRAIDFATAGQLSDQEPDPIEGDRLWATLWYFRLLDGLEGAVLVSAALFTERIDAIPVVDALMADLIGSLRVE